MHSSSSLEGGVKILEKSLLGRGGAEIFILVVKGGGEGHVIWK